MRLSRRWRWLREIDWFDAIGAFLTALVVLIVIGFLVVIGVAIWTSGDDSDGFTSGTVIGKSHTDGYSTPIPISCGKGCVTIITTWQPPTDTLHVGWCTPDCHTKDIDVSDTVYGQFNVGDTYPRPAGR